MQTIATQQTVFHAFEHLQQEAGLVHFMSSRKGGYSQPPFNGLNAGFTTGDDAEIVRKNRRQLADAVNIPLKNFVFPQQVHGANASIITAQERGRGAFLPHDAISQTDALITNEKNTCLVIQTADCLPLILYDTANKAIAVIHAGWRGTVAQITKHTIDKMQAAYGTQPQYILAGIGTGITVRNYQVGKEVTRAVRQAFGTTKGHIEQYDDKEGDYFNLLYSNRQQLLQAGVKTENIAVSPLCSYSNSSLFFSARRARSQPTGRMITGAYLV